LDRSFLEARISTSSARFMVELPVVVLVEV
jgi:hypothetical protein